METSRTPSASECVTVPRRRLTMGCSAAVSVENYTQLLLVQGGWSSGTLLVSPAIQTAKPGRSSLMLEVISRDFGGGVMSGGSTRGFWVLVMTPSSHRVFTWVCSVWDNSPSCALKIFLFCCVSSTHQQNVSLNCLTLIVYGGGMWTFGVCVPQIHYIRLVCHFSPPHGHCPTLYTQPGHVCGLLPHL